MIEKQDKKNTELKKNFFYGNRCLAATPQNCGCIMEARTRSWATPRHTQLIDIMIRREYGFQIHINTERQRNLFIYCVCSSSDFFEGLQSRTSMTARCPAGSWRFISWSSILNDTQRLSTFKKKKFLMKRGVRVGTILTRVTGLARPSRTYDMQCA